MPTTVAQTQLQEVLEDSKIHLTGYGPSAASTSSASTEHTTRTVSNPPNWPTDHRRVPDYRPIEYGRDAEERPNGTVLPETIFISIMFTGVFINAVSPQVVRYRNKTDYFDRLLPRFGVRLEDPTFPGYFDTRLEESGDDWRMNSGWLRGRWPERGILQLP